MAVQLMKQGCSSAATCSESALSTFVDYKPVMANSWPITLPDLRSDYDGLIR